MSVLQESPSANASPTSSTCSPPRFISSELFGVTGVQFGVRGCGFRVPVVMRGARWSRAAYSQRNSAAAFSLEVEPGNDPPVFFW